MLHQQVLVDFQLLVFLFDHAATSGSRLLRQLELEVEADELSIEKLIQQMTHTLSVTLPIINNPGT